MKNATDMDMFTRAAIESRRELASWRDKDFLCRVYKSGLDIYLNRLKALKFEGLGRVLDAGCGFGQWSLALSLLNEDVDAVDCNESRVKICKKIAQEAKRANIAFQVGLIEGLPYDSDTFDAVFCYSAIYQADYRKALREFYRVLKVNGVIYISTNDWGWCIYNLILNYNPSADFNSRIYAIETIFNTLRFMVTKRHTLGKDLVMPCGATTALMKETGFKNISIGPEGHLIRNHSYRPRPIYSSKYLGLRAVYEVLGEK